MAAAMAQGPVLNGNVRSIWDVEQVRNDTYIRPYHERNF